MTKKSFTIFVAIFIFAFQLNAIAAVKAGSNCSKLGATSTYAGKKYTCIKSGKKLVWNKGVTVTKPVPAITPTPSPSPTQTSAPTPSPTATSAPFVEGGNCEKMGIQGKDSTGLLECRKIVGNKLIYIRITNNFEPIVNPTSPDPLTTCQLPDMRTTKLWPQPGIAFPPVSIGDFKPAGNFKIVVVGIDFSDAPGKVNPSTYWDADLAVVDDWIKWYTNEKVKYNYLKVDKWLRAPRLATAYENDGEAPKTGANTTFSTAGVSDAEKTTEFLKIIESEADMSNVAAVWIYHPPSVEGKLTGQWYSRDVNYQSAKYGKITSALFAIGGDTWYSMRTRWGYWLHEMMHSHGIFGHYVKVPWRIGLMSTADSWSTALLSWDSLAQGWTNPENLYCVEKSKVTSVDLKLVPLEREQKGNRVAMIKLNDHQVLMVESHRKDKWSDGLAPGFTGVMVTLIDTTKNTTWDNPEGFANPSSIAQVLKIPGVNHGPYESVGTPHPNPGNMYQGVGIINGIGVSGDKEGWDQNYFMYQGESVTYEGIKISLSSTGDNDTIRIEKTS
ncbi:hypothetical protein MCEMRE191_01340 [Candidatus Nanopelagicaceae bacterium]